MARTKKTDTKPIEQYDHKGKQRINNPPVGLVTPETDPDFTGDMPNTSYMSLNGKKIDLPTVIREESVLYRSKLHMNYERTCRCGPTHINCMTAKEWLKSQLGVWQFNYEARDIRDKSVHPGILQYFY